jgi:hypothetical protein
VVVVIFFPYRFASVLSLGHHEQLTGLPVDEMVTDADDRLSLPLFSAHLLLCANAAVVGVRESATAAASIGPMANSRGVMFVII